MPGLRGIDGCSLRGWLLSRDIGHHEGFIDGYFPTIFLPVISPRSPPYSNPPLELGLPRTILALDKAES